MIRIQYIYILIIGAVALMPYSCTESLDINKDPLSATTADPNVILPFVFVQYSNRHTTELGTRMMDVPQHFSACFFSPFEGTTDNLITGKVWEMMYTRVLGNLFLVEQDALEAGPSSYNVAAIAKIFKAHAYFELSMIWEKIPFQQAINAVEYPTPAFDDQPTVLNGVLTQLDEAISLIDDMPATGVYNVSVGDLIYEGNMSLWRRYANSLKLRILMILRNKTDVSAQISTVLSQPLIESNSQSALLRYANAPGQTSGYNGLVEAFFGVSNEAQGVFGPSETLFNLLEGDPRFDMIISNPNNDRPISLGLFPFASGGPTISDNVIRNDLPHMFMMPAEINFYRAEIALANGNMTEATNQYKLGVRNNMLWWGGDIPGARATIDNAVIDAFVDALETPTLEEVYEQLFIESFIRPVVAWNTVRRTKVPVLSPPPGASISTILKRFTYPPNESDSNPNTPVNAPTDTPMWFEN